MIVDALETSKGRIEAHLLCLGRSLRRGRLGSLKFFCAGICRNFPAWLRESWQSHRMQVAK